MTNHNPSAADIKIAESQVNRPVDQSHPAGITRDNAAKCLAVRLRAGNRATGSGGGFLEQTKNALGSIVGQAAFNKVLGSIPKIRVDNSVNAGVRLLADSVNAGTSGLVGGSVNAASRAVFSAAGIVTKIPADPNGRTVFNNAQTASDTLAAVLVTGIVDEADLPGPISSLSALAFLQQNKAQVEFDADTPNCAVTPYAMDLIEYAPKHNFMFLVQFEFYDDYRTLGMQQSSTVLRTDHTSPEAIKFHYLCREFSRPAVDIEYEDINMYNFRTKVAKRILYEPVTIRLYDDIKNSSMVFLEKYLKARSPIARVNTIAAIGNKYERTGMSFDTVNTGETGPAASLLSGGSASMGGLINENIAILKAVSVFHIFDYGARLNKYTYINPKIMQLDGTDFSMEPGAEPTSIEIKMAYDSMFIETDIKIVKEIRDNSKLGQFNIYRQGDPIPR